MGGSHIAPERRGTGAIVLRRVALCSPRVALSQPPRSSPASVPPSSPSPSPRVPRPTSWHLLALHSTVPHIPYFPVRRSPTLPEEGPSHERWGVYSCTSPTNDRKTCPRRKCSRFRCCQGNMQACCQNASYQRTLLHWIGPSPQTSRSLKRSIMSGWSTLL